MIVKGIIKSIDFKSNTCMVRIPTWEPVGNPETVIPAVFSVTPGTFNGYKENDVVWVAFENNIASKPVVIGKLYAGTNADKTETRGVINCKSLTVSDSAVLPASTKITQATSDVLDERNGLQVQTLDELITAVAANAASISNLVILEENPLLGSVVYSYAFSASEVSVVQPTADDWNKLKEIADSKSKSELTKDDLTTAQLSDLSDAAQLWLTAGGKWLKGTGEANDPKSWEPHTGYISDEDWIKNPDAYPLLNVFKRTRSIYYQQGLDKVVTTEELVRSPKTSYPTEYSLKMTADTHAGPNQTETLYVIAVKRFAGTLEEEDTDASLWYWSPDFKKWVPAKTTDPNLTPSHKLTLTLNTFKNNIKDRDLVVIATHTSAFDPNTIKTATKLPDPLELNADLSTWGNLVADERVYEIETIPYSPLNTPVINLDNDSAALPYDQDGVNVLYNSTVSTTAKVFLNGDDISSDFIFEWYQWEQDSNGELINKHFISDSSSTITVGEAGVYEVVAIKTGAASPSYSVPGDKLVKIFTVAKQVQGEAMMSSVITSSAGTSFNTKNVDSLTTTLTAYLYRGTEEYLPDSLYYEWYTISESDQTGTLIPSNDYNPVPLDDKTQKSIQIKNVAKTLKDKSVYFIAYNNEQHTDVDANSILGVARLGITTAGK